jgi:formyltetrahydrofolate synthetase
VALAEAVVGLCSAGSDAGDGFGGGGRPGAEAGAGFGGGRPGAEAGDSPDAGAVPGSGAGGGGFRLLYEDGLGIEAKIEAIATKIYRAADVKLTPEAVRQIEQIEKLGFGGAPVCIAKTQYSFSDDPTVLGAPDGWTLTVKSLKMSAGAGFVVALTGDIMTMPGLPKSPAAERIDVDGRGVVSGLF